MESSRKLSEIKELHNKIHQSAEESKKKEALYKQLVLEHILNVFGMSYFYTVFIWVPVHALYVRHNFGESDISFR